MRSYRILLLLTTSLAMGACSILPSDGPMQADGRQTAVNAVEAIPYELVNVTPAVLEVLQKGTDHSDFGQFDTKAPRSDVRLGPGDVIGITIFETQAGGLFIPAEPGTRQGNFVPIPNQQVDSKGMISVPYAGQINVLGRQLTEVQKIIEQKLASRAIEPQAVVSLQERNSAQVSVLGDVHTPTKFALTPQGDRVLDAIARAGGLNQQGYETYVTIQRGSREATMYLQTIVKQPKFNVYLQPGDVVYAYKETRAFIALGAQGSNGRYVFDTERMSLSDALGKAGGLLDDRANPESVFVYRFVDRKTAADLGIDVTKYTSVVPVIFRADLRNQAGFFATAQLEIKNRDVLFVGNSIHTELLKAITLYYNAASSANVTSNIGR